MGSAEASLYPFCRVALPVSYSALDGFIGQLEQRRIYKLWELVRRASRYSL